MKQVCSKIPYNREFQIYVVRDDEGDVEWISLHDLCKILKRKEMYETGEIFRLCPSCKGFPVYGNGKLYIFIRIYDIHVLLRAVRKEEKQAASICDEIEKWLATLPVCKYKKTKQLPVPVLPPATPVTFTFNNQPVSFMTSNGKTFFNATQMAKGFGRTPREWLLLSGTKRFRQALIQRGKSGSMESQIITMRGSRGVTWMEESLGMEFARWLSPEFFDWCNERVKELIAAG
jgi:prophage antirepressor-like protein